MTTLAVRAREQAIERSFAALASDGGRDVGERARAVARRSGRRADRRTPQRRAGPRAARSSPAPSAARSSSGRPAPARVS